jgi:hypothetical protein
MSIKERTIKELESLGPDDLLRIHDLILLLKSRAKSGPLAVPGTFEEVQRLLATCPGSLADDIIRGRAERE